MPLIKSKSDKAFKHTIKAEIAAGKPQKQAVAIAYNTKRVAKKATGGSTDPMHYDSDQDYYETLASKGIKRPAGWTKSERESVLSGKAAEPSRQAAAKFKEELHKKYAANAEKNAEYDKRIKESVNERRKSKGMPPLKSGGKVTKHCGGW